jgi:5-methylcytosine-specific restriction protein A
MANGLCEHCLKKGIVRAGREVHHIIPIEEDWNKRLDIDNLVLLCPDCHNAEHERISPLQKFLKDWENI